MKIKEKTIKKRVFNLLNKMRGEEMYRFKFDDSFLKVVENSFGNKQDEQTLNVSNERVEDNNEQCKDESSNKLE